MHISVLAHCWLLQFCQKPRSILNLFHTLSLSPLHESRSCRFLHSFLCSLLLSFLFTFSATKLFKVVSSFQILLLTFFVLFHLLFVCFSSFPPFSSTVFKLTCSEFVLPFIASSFPMHCSNVDILSIAAATVYSLRFSFPCKCKICLSF